MMTEGAENRLERPQPRKLASGFPAALHPASAIARFRHSPKLPQFGRYVLVGGTMTAFGYGAIFFCMYVLKWGPLISNLVAYGLGITFSYWMNRTYTFRSQGRKAPEALKFLVVFAVSYSLNLAVLSILIARGVNPALSQILAGGVYVVATFAANKAVVFNTKRVNGADA